MPEGPSRPFTARMKAPWRSKATARLLPQSVTQIRPLPSSGEVLGPEQRGGGRAGSGARARSRGRDGSPELGHPVAAGVEPDDPVGPVLAHDAGPVVLGQDVERPVQACHAPAQDVEQAVVRVVAEDLVGAEGCHVERAVRAGTNGGGTPEGVAAPRRPVQADGDHVLPFGGQVGGEARPRAHQLQLVGEQGRGPAGSGEPAPRIERLGHVAGLQQRPAQPVERTRAGRGDAHGLLEGEHGVVEHAPVPRDHAPPELGLRAGGCEVDSLGCEGGCQDDAEEDCDAQRLHGSQYREIRRRYLRCARRSRRAGGSP